MLPKPQVSYKTASPGVIEANCTSVSRPPAEIVWNVERDNRTMGPPVTKQLSQDDGTTLVISTLTVQSGLLKDVSVKCLVHHKGLESPIAVSMNTKSKLVLLILLLWRSQRLSFFALRYVTLQTFFLQAILQPRMKKKAEIVFKCSLKDTDKLHYTSSHTCRPIFVLCRSVEPFQFFA